MAPSIHPPCTPSASCVPVRCHPTPPPCQNPEKCLKRTISKGIRPCQSAVSIMSTRSKSKCQNCGKCKSKAGNPRSVLEVKKFLRKKSKEAKMRKRDRLTGSRSYTKYIRRQGSKRSKTDCCAGHGHRGRLKKSKSTYSSKSIKPCVSEPSCSVHRHRPRPAPCPQPDKCYKKCIKRKQKCPSAMATVTRPGSPCECARIQSQDSRTKKKRGFKTHRKRIRKAYRTNSQESRWERRKKCCVIL